MSGTHTTVTPVTHTVSQRPQGGVSTVTRLKEQAKTSLPSPGRRKSQNRQCCWLTGGARESGPSLPAWRGHAGRRRPLFPSNMGSKRYTTLLASGSPGPSSPFPTLSSDCSQLVSERQSKRVKLHYGEPLKNCRAQLLSWRAAQVAKVGPSPTQLGLTEEIRSRKWCSSLAFIYNWKNWLFACLFVLSRHRPQARHNQLAIHEHLCYFLTNSGNEIAPREVCATHYIDSLWYATKPRPQNRN